MEWREILRLGPFDHSVGDHHEDRRGRDLAKVQIEDARQGQYCGHRQDGSSVGFISARARRLAKRMHCAVSRYFEASSMFEGQRLSIRQRRPRSSD